MPGTRTRERGELETQIMRVLWEEDGARVGVWRVLRLFRERGLRVFGPTKEAAQLAQQKDGRRRFVAGAIGPTNRTLSISPDVNDPAARSLLDPVAPA